MSAKIDEFKEFVKGHPGLKTVIDNKEKTWQNIFEEWVLYGGTESWDKYRDGTISDTAKTESSGDMKTTTATTTKEVPMSKEVAQLGEVIKSCVGYVKKINPDNISKTISNIQKVMALVAGLGAANTANIAASQKMTGDPLFDRRFDEWY